MNVQLYQCDCLAGLLFLEDSSVDAIVTDPPYGLSFMGRKWDYDVPGVEVWTECLRVLKPGGHLLAFAGTRTQHRMAVRIEDAGFEIRDMIAWVYGSGFPKSLDVSKAVDSLDAAGARRERQLRFTEWMRGTGMTASRIDAITATNMGGHYTTAASQPAVATREHFEKLRLHIACDVPAWVEKMVDERTVESENMKRREVVGISKNGIAGGSGMHAGESGAYGFASEYKLTAPATEAAKQWEGWGTALKPALEPITVARKPLTGTVAANVLEHGTGALNIDGCRVGDDYGRWPANLIHDGSDEVLAQFPHSTSGSMKASTARAAQDEPGSVCYGTLGGSISSKNVAASSGSAARFFYCAKASRSDRNAGLATGSIPAVGTGATMRERENADWPARNGNHHPTVKPTDLMSYLCRLVTPPGGLVLDPFMGSGSTGKACMQEGFQFIGIEREAEYLAMARARISLAQQEAVGRRA